MFVVQVRFVSHSAGQRTYQYLTNTKKKGTKSVNVFIKHIVTELTVY